MFALIGIILSIVIIVGVAFLWDRFYWPSILQIIIYVLNAIFCAICGVSFVLGIAIEATSQDEIAYRETIVALLEDTSNTDKTEAVKLATSYNYEVTVLNNY